VLNDIHLDIEADPNVMPIFGNETTQILLVTMLQKAKDSGQQYDAVLLPGDFVKHGIDSTDTTKPNS
jgi:predicted phosphohydrolase